MISARRRPAAPPLAPRAQGVRAPTHIPFRWQGAQGPQFSPVGGVQAFVSEGEKSAYLRDTMRQEVQLYKGTAANEFLQDKVADEMAKEVAKGVLEEHKSRPDRDYNACFQSWLLGKNDVLNNPLITQRGYTSYVQKFPRVINWVDAQIRLASEIKVYLTRLYIEGPSTEEEVEHEFRYLVWPLNNALRVLQQARNDPSLGPEVLRGVQGGAWDPQHQTAADSPWPAELTYMGRVPDTARKDIPPCLHPALNPYMRDQWVYSVSYKEWLAGDYSKLRGDSRELWEVVANRLYGRNDRMQKPKEDDTDPQQYGGWQGAPRPEGAWNAPRQTATACGNRQSPATAAPLVPSAAASVGVTAAAPAPSRDEREQFDYGAFAAKFAAAAAAGTPPATPVSSDATSADGDVEMESAEQQQEGAASSSTDGDEATTQPPQTQQQVAAAQVEAAAEATATAATQLAEAATTAAAAAASAASVQDDESSVAPDDTSTEASSQTDAEMIAALLQDDVLDVEMTAAEENALVAMAVGDATEEDHTLAAAVLRRVGRKRRAKQQGNDVIKKRRLEDGKLIEAAPAAEAVATAAESESAQAAIAHTQEAIEKINSSINLTQLRDRLSDLGRNKTMTSDEALEVSDIVLKLDAMYKKATGGLRKKFIARILGEHGVRASIYASLVVDTGDIDHILKQYRGK